VATFSTGGSSRSRGRRRRAREIKILGAGNRERYTNSLL